MSKLHNEARFKHVSYHATDLAKTFARIRKQQAEEKAKSEENRKQAAKVVRPINRRSQT